jgi:ABC-type amino acid transport substrate-binding protein
MGLKIRFVDYCHRPRHVSSSQGVLVAKDITGPVTLARLRTLQVCAKQVTTGFGYVQDVLRYGAIAGRVGPTEHYGGLLPKGSPLRPAVNNGIESLKRNGTTQKIAARHFGSALASTPVIR